MEQRINWKHRHLSSRFTRLNFFLFLLFSTSAQCKRILSTVFACMRFTFTTLPFAARCLVKIKKNPVKRAAAAAVLATIPKPIPVCRYSIYMYTVTVHFVYDICDEWLFVVVSWCVVSTLCRTTSLLSTKTSTLWLLKSFECCVSSQLIFFYAIFCENDETLFFTSPTICVEFEFGCMKGEAGTRRRVRIENSYHSSPGFALRRARSRCSAIQFTFFFRFPYAGMLPNRKRFKTK